MNVTDQRPLPPMPETRCPSWCARDHASDWATQLALFSKPYVIPMTDGTTVTGGPYSADQIAALWEPNHTLRLFELRPDAGESVDLDLHQPSDGCEAYLYLDAQRGLTATQALAVARALMDGAERMVELRQP